MIIIDYKDDFIYPNEGLDLHWFARKSESKAFYIAPHGHNYYEFFVITKGSLIQVLNNEEVQMNLLDAQLIRPGDFHGFKLVNENEAVEHLNVGVSEETFISLCDTMGNDVFQTINNALITHKGLSSFYLEKTEFDYIEKNARPLSLDSTRNEQTKMLIKTILIIFINSLYNKLVSSKQESPIWFRQLLTEINKVSNISLTPKEVYQLANYSSTMTNYFFKKYLGTTVSKHLQNIKIEFAKTLLRTTNYSIYQICDTLGISSTSYFNHLFVGAVGVTPLQYRKIKQ